MRSKRHINILLLIPFFSLVFHVTPNSPSTNLKNDGVDWDIRMVLHVSFKVMYFVL